MQGINKTGSQTFRLFSELPSFFGGVVGLFDFRAVLGKYNTDVTEELADENSLASDWKTVGSDMKIALTEAYEKRRREEVAGV